MAIQEEDNENSDYDDGGLSEENHVSKLMDPSRNNIIQIKMDELVDKGEAILVNLMEEEDTLAKVGDRLYIRGFYEYTEAIQHGINMELFDALYAEQYTKEGYRREISEKKMSRLVAGGYAEVMALGHQEGVYARIKEEYYTHDKKKGIFKLAKDSKKIEHFIEKFIEEETKSIDQESGQSPEQ